MNAAAKQTGHDAGQAFLLHAEPDRWDWLTFAAITLFIYGTRQVFGGSVYFVDGPLLVASIRLKWFVIQSPGYWLYAHLGGLFHDPATGLAFWNKLFSALGTAVFFLLARMLGTGRSLALLAAFTYGFSYHVWFSGEIHSSYAAEILFPVLTLCCFLKLEQRRALLWAVATALSAGLAIALRPSDGIFLIPLWGWLLWRGRSSWRTVAAFALVSALVFLGWYLPTQHAMQRIGFNNAQSQMLICFRATSVFFVGITRHSIANVARVYVPLLLAYWALLPLLFRHRDRDANAVLALWVAPGLLFFTLGYMADPTYVVYLSGAFVLAALLQKQKKLAAICLTVCLAWNATVFLAARPSAGGSPADTAWNYYLVKYCAYGIRHHWMATMRQALPSGKVM